MAGFLYFVPDLAQTPDKALLASLGLDYAFSRQPTPSGVTNGPEKLSGMILYDANRVASGRAQYQPAVQRWQKWTTAKGRLIFVGLEIGSEPSPGDLQRVSMLDGLGVELADERMWVVPVARDWSLTTDGKLGFSIELPQTAAMNEAGQWQEGEVAPRYRQLWQMSVDYYQVVRGVADDETDARVKATLFDMAAECLAANYLVGPAECSLLSLFTFTHAKRVLDALIRRDWLEEILQKKTVPGPEASATSALSSGPEGSPESIDLP